MTTDAEVAAVTGTWLPIASAPTDGSWFIIGCFDYGEPTYEVGRYQPLIHDQFVEAGDGLYRKQPEQIYDWYGFNNFHRASHWMSVQAPSNDLLAQAGAGERGGA